MEYESQQMNMELKRMEYEHQIKLRELDLRNLELERPAAPAPSLLPHPLTLVRALVHLWGSAKTSAGW
ncbi:hypothetical protein NHX12_028890 [Muraenolepis orangiensis]|uniref:Uncharacterized protein n=1 Tax=Muraenolepis orangiensis TaxID=630683 RepID=A0A9Q0IMK8_9TELE|nr:hypothetical protein NHX12_028890 [Muraenolepis orangiensis]